MNSHSSAVKTYTKLQLVVFLLAYFLLAFLISILAFTLVYMRPYTVGDLRYFGFRYMCALACYSIGILVAPFVVNANYSLKHYLDINYFLNGQQRKLGYAFIILVFAIVSFYLMMTLNQYNFLGYFYKAPLTTAIISIITVQFIERKTLSKETWIQSVMLTGDNGPQCTQTMYGSASWITDRQKNDLTVPLVENQPGFEGLWLGGGFFHDKPGNLVSVAPPGSGKGAALIIPNLLWNRQYKHSFVVFDPKGTNACITARFRLTQGHKVIIIDPMGLQQLNKATHQIPASCFNPLDHIKDDIFNGTAQIANLMLPDDPCAKDKYWNTDGRNLIQLVLMHIMTYKTFVGYRNLTTLHQVLISGKIPLFLEEATSNMALDGLISDTASGFLVMIKSTEKTFFSILSIAGASIKWLSNPVLQKAMYKSDFSPDDLVKGDMTIYICQPIANKEGFATFSRLITGFCLRANSRPSDSRKPWVYYLLDEFPTMGVFPEVIEALAYSREYNMRLWLFSQSLSQLDSMYKPETRHEIIGNSTIFQAFGVTDQITQEYVSKRVGNQTVRFETQNASSSYSQNSSSSPGGGSSGSSHGQSSGYSEAFQGRPLISPDELERDPNIITLTQWGPMRLVRWQYWQTPNDPYQMYYHKIYSDGRADENPNMRVSQTYPETPGQQATNVNSGAFKNNSQNYKNDATGTNTRQYKAEQKADDDEPVYGSNKSRVTFRRRRR